MIYQNRSIIASKRNANGVTVYIPERMKLSGQRYVVPFKMSGVTPSVSHGTIFSRKEKLDITLLFSSFTISITDPFSRASLQNAIAYMQKNTPKRGSASLTLSRDEYAAIIPG